MDNTSHRPTGSEPYPGTREEHRLYEQGERGTLSETDRQKLTKVEVDQCWDLLRQRRALRGAGRDPDMAQVRSAQVVEKYEQ